MQSLRQKLETDSPKRSKANRTHLANAEADTPVQADSETSTRKELGKLFNVSHEAIRIWEENGKLKDQGWERIPSAGNPVRYRRVAD